MSQKCFYVQTTREEIKSLFKHNAKNKIYFPLEDAAKITLQLHSYVVFASKLKPSYNFDIIDRLNEPDWSCETRKDYDSHLKEQTTEVYSYKTKFAYKIFLFNTYCNFSQSLLSTFGSNPSYDRIWFLAVIIYCLQKKKLSAFLIY